MPIALSAIGALFSQLVIWIMQKWLLSQFAKYAAILTAFSLIFIAFAGFTSLIYSLAAAAYVAAPSQLSFAFGLIPPSAPLLISAYYTALIAKRIFDWTQLVIRQKAEFDAAEMAKWQY